jgi:hypothetical protein
MKLDMNIWFVAHEVTEWGKDEKTGQRTEVGKAPDVWDKLIYELDLTLHAQKRGGSRVGVIYKSRLVGFPDAESLTLDYDEFSERYGKDFIESASKTIELATSAQLDAIKSLLENVRVTEAEIEKVFTRASVDKWEELTTQQADATIQWLKNKIK